MKVGNKICPFRRHENIDAKCESECQLFVSGKTLEEGSCALSALPSIKHAIAVLDQTVATIVATAK